LLLLVPSFPLVIVITIIITFIIKKELDVKGLKITFSFSQSSLLRIAYPIMYARRTNLLFTI